MKTIELNEKHINIKDGKIIKLTPEFMKELNRIHSKLINNGKCDANIKLIIPDNINDIKISTIGEGAFKELPYITDIVIEDGIERIESCAFENDEKLKSIKLPENLKIINENLFHHCNALLSIKIPDNVTEIRKCAFFSCENLESIILPKNLLEIGELTFINCYNLKHIDLPESLEVIGKYAFSSCRSLKDIKIPSKIKKIKSYTFNDCKHLENIILTNNINEIEYQAFSDCFHLETIMLPKNLKKISWGTFCNCTNLNKIDLPKSITGIESEAFCNCQILEAVIIPENVEHLGDSAFADCLNLRSVKYYDKIQDVGQNAFRDTPWLKNECEKKSFVAINNILLDIDETKKNIVIPNGIINMATNISMSDNGIESITIPKSVKYIVSTAFHHHYYNQVLPVYYKGTEKEFNEIKDRTEISKKYYNFDDDFNDGCESYPYTNVERYKLNGHIIIPTEDIIKPLNDISNFCIDKISFKSVYEKDYFFSVLDDRISKTNNLNEKLQLLTIRDDVNKDIICNDNGNVEIERF